jgi:hypothetical protein
MADLRAEFPAESEGEDSVSAARDTAGERQPEAPAAEHVAPVPRAERDSISTPPVAVESPAAPELPVEATPLPHAPQVIASFAPPPATYKILSEHAPVEEEAHRPVRRRRHESESAVAAEPLQLVETVAAAIPSQPAFADEIERRPVRRRRQANATAAPAEPLQLVETAPGAATTDAGAPQA